MNKLRISILAILLSGAAYASAENAYTHDSNSDKPALVVSVPSVEVRAGQIEITNTASQQKHFAIYALTGQIVKQLAVQPGASATIDLPAGYYIVKSERFSKKVVIR